VDVDHKKINLGYYTNKDIDVKIPILHFSLLASDPDVRQRLQRCWEEGEYNSRNEPGFGRIDKSKPENRLAKPKNDEHKGFPQPPKKKRRLYSVKEDVLDFTILPQLPVVVCVAMYRTNGALEHNVKSIGRTEGLDLWHFS